MFFTLLNVKVETNLNRLGIIKHLLQPAASCNHCATQQKSRATNGKEHIPFIKRAHLPRDISPPSSETEACRGREGRKKKERNNSAAAFKKIKTVLSLQLVITS